MKKILVGVGGAVVLGLLSYPGFGLLVEQGVRHQISVMPKQYGMTVKLVDFHRHWFTSDAKILWKWQIPAHLSQNAQGQTITVSPQNFEKEFPIHFFHGPISFSKGSVFFGIGHANTVLEWPLFNTLPTKSEFASESIFPHIDIQMALNFLYQTTWKTSIPPFKLSSLNKTNSLNWQGFELYNRIQGRASSVRGQLKFVGGQLDFTELKSYVHLKNLFTKYYLKHHNSGLMIGKIKLKFDHLGFQQFAEHQYQFSDLDLNARSNVKDESFDTEFDTKLGFWTVDGQKYGPLTMDLQISELNARSLAKLQEILQPEENASPSFRQRNFWSVIATIPDLLKHGLVIDLKDFHLDLHEGMIDAKAHISLAPDLASSFLGLQFLQNLQGNIDLSLPKELLNQFLVSMVVSQLHLSQEQEQSSLDATTLEREAGARVQAKLNKLTQDGVLILENSNYAFHISIAQGQLSINNKTFDPSWLLV
jgi:uncharacterized protein YdgA (DUF945 family)